MSEKPLERSENMPEWRLSILANLPFQKNFFAMEEKGFCVEKFDRGHNRYKITILLNGKPNIITIRTNGQISHMPMSLRGTIETFLASKLREVATALNLIHEDDELDGMTLANEITAINSSTSTKLTKI